MSKVAQPNFNETRVNLGDWIYKNPLFRMYRVGGEIRQSLYIGRQDNMCLLVMKSGALPLSRYTAATILWLNRRTARREV